jgi:hypothetical protein
MSQQKSEAIVGGAFSETDVAAYLRSHPDFFERHTPLLLRLKLPHESGTATISLVERQVSMLRQRNDDLERQLKDLVAVAKANNELVENIHKLALEFLEIDGLEAKLERLERSLRENFAAERAQLVLFTDTGRPRIERRGFVRPFDREDEALKPFATFLRAGRPRCGSMRDRQKELLFERDADSIASAAMVPIGEGARLGFLVIGSVDEDQFHPGKRVDFLARLGELIATALESEYARARRS